MLDGEIFLIQKLWYSIFLELITIDILDMDMDIPDLTCLDMDIMTIGILITVHGTAILTGILITATEDIGLGVTTHGYITVGDIIDGDITDGEIQIIMKTLTKVDLTLTEIIKMFHTVKVEEEVQVVL
tara:strand:- start:769 stop:1152 length:384 start_codon:yes stop_codon:yes gene_type:complete